LRFGDENGVDLVAVACAHMEASSDILGSAVRDGMRKRGEKDRK
jgi:hypothetical protein